MGYTAGDTILDDEYNVFVNSSSDPYGYNHFAGSGSGVYGLNQSSIATVSAGETISASNWNALFTGLDNIANHTNTSITSTSVSAGDTIAIKSALVTDLANLAAAVAAGSTSATAITTGVAAGTSTNSGTWNTTSTIERSVTFADNATMRAFFNAGGYIGADPGISGSVDGNKDTVFSELAAAVGNLNIKAHSTQRTGTGETETSLASSTGFHDLGTSYTSLIVLNSDNGADYNSNTIEIQAKLDAAVSSATVLTIKMISTDAAGDETYDPSNPAGVSTNPNEAPAMVLAIIENHPNDTEGLASAIRVSSNAQVSNSQS
jgi:hypothetical protein